MKKVKFPCHCHVLSCLGNFGNFVPFDSLPLQWRSLRFFGLFFVFTLHNFARPSLSMSPEIVSFVIDAGVRKVLQIPTIEKKRKKKRESLLALCMAAAHTQYQCTIEFWIHPWHPKKRPLFNHSLALVQLKILSSKWRGDSNAWEQGKTNGRRLV